MPWPDNLAIVITALVHGNDDRGRLMRRTLMRYVQSAWYGRQETKTAHPECLPQQHSQNPTHKLWSISHWLAFLLWHSVPTSNKNQSGQKITFNNCQHKKFRYSKGLWPENRILEKHADTLSRYSMVSNIRHWKQDHNTSLVSWPDMWTCPG